MQIITWKSPLHIVKASIYKTVVGELAEVKTVNGHDDVVGKNYEDALFATPAFNPLEVNVEFNIIKRYELGDWTVSTAIITAYGYAPPRLKTPVPAFYPHPAKATMNTLLTAFDTSFIEKADDTLYELLSLMCDGAEALRVVATALEEMGSVEETVNALSEDGPGAFKMCPPEKAYKVYEDMGLTQFLEEDVPKYSEEVTKNEEPKLLGSTMVNLITDEVTQSANASVDDEVITCDTKSPVSDRYELTYSHIDWNKFYWADHVSGVAEGGK